LLGEKSGEKQVPMKRKRRETEQPEKKKSIAVLSEEGGSFVSFLSSGVRKRKPRQIMEKRRKGGKKGSRIRKKRSPHALSEEKASAKARAV